MNFYNDNDRHSAAWLRELIAAGLIPPGDVDERSITDIQPHELTKYSQCHWFAGISGWSRALELAGWPADRPVWTGSCPCQSFSCAGKGKAGDDPRHLWPAWFRLIRECRPERIFGEQVEAAIGHGWLDRVFTDLEAENYACGAAVLGAHSVSAPHRRQRLYWLAHAGASGRGALQRPVGADRLAAVESDGFSDAGRVGDANVERLEIDLQPDGDPAQDSTQRYPLRTDTDRSSAWSDAIWIKCADGRSRKLESGTTALVARLPRGVVPSGDPSVAEAQASGEARVMRLRGYGNSIVPPLAAEFIRASFP